MARFVVAAPGPHYSVADVYRGWIEGLRENGQHVATFNLDDRLIWYDQVYVKRGRRYVKALDDTQSAELALSGLPAQLWKFRPHVLMVISGLITSTEILDHARQAYGTKVVIVHTESPYEDRRQLAMAAHADLNLVNDPVSVPRFEGIGPVAYAPHGYRPSLHCPGPAEAALACDLGFVGTAFKSRISFFEDMLPGLEGLHLSLAGNWADLPDASPLRPHIIHPADSCWENTNAARLYRSMRAGINVYRREADCEDDATGVACGPREIEMAACGAFFLRDPRPESDRLFPFLPGFDGPEDAADKLRWWLARPDVCRAAGMKAREAVADRTFTRHAAELMRLLQIRE